MVFVPFIAVGLGFAVISAVVTGATIASSGGF